jgi:hypothetical protein
MTITVESAKPSIGGIVRVDKAYLLDDDVIETVRSSLEERGVLVFRRLMSVTKSSSPGRVNFKRNVPGGDAATPDVYSCGWVQRVAFAVTPVHSR